MDKPLDFGLLKSKLSSLNDVNIARDGVVLSEGAWGTVQLIRLPDGSVPVWEWLKEEKQIGRPECLKLGVTFKQIAEFGPMLRNTERFKHFDATGARLWEIKQHQVRLLGDFRDPRRFMIAHGLIKKRDHLRDADFERALRMLDEFDRMQKGGKR